MIECYQTFEQKVRIGHYDLISCFSNSNFYFILYSENQCISKLDKIGIFIDMQFHSLISKFTFCIFLSVAWPTGVQLMFFFSSGVSKLFGAQGSPSSGSLLNL